jgi:hypothetical protein
MKRKWVLRVVLASPGDVKDEREAVERAVAHVNFLLKTADASVFLELWRYERDTHPGLHPMGPQELIESLHRSDRKLLQKKSYESVRGSNEFAFFEALHETEAAAACQY